MSEDELDQILADQYHACQRRLKNIKRLRRLLHDKESLDLVEERTYGLMMFFETMIINKKLLKKHKHKKEKPEDILGRNQIRTILKNAFVYSNLSYKMMMSYWNAYTSFWKQQDRKTN